MRARIAIVVLSVGLISLSACETPGPDSSQIVSDATPRCFNVHVLSGFETIDRDTLRVREGGRRYDIDLSGPDCDRIEWTQRIALQSAAGSSDICVGDQFGDGRVAFSVPETRRPVECRIEAVRSVSNGAGI